MSKKNKKKLTTLLIIILLVILLMSCKNINKSINQNLTFNLNEDIGTLDPTLSQMSSESIVLINAFEGLMKFDTNDKLILGVAEKVDISDDNLIYKFKIRKNAKWSDGKEVTSHDFIYSWFRSLDKEVNSNSVDQLFCIENAENYYNRKVLKKSVGIRAIDDKTLEVKLKSPIKYFLELTTNPIYMPLRKDSIENKKFWIYNPKTYISNGAFALKNILYKQEIVFEKNKYFWNEKNVYLDNLTFNNLDDLNISYSNLQNSIYDIISTVPPLKIKEGINDNIVKINPLIATYSLDVNVNNNNNIPTDIRVFLSNKKVRKALSLAINRDVIAKNIVISQGIPAYGYIPIGIKNLDDINILNNQYNNIIVNRNMIEKDIEVFHENLGKIDNINYFDFANKKYFDEYSVNYEKAIELLKEAGYGDGLKKIPTLEILTIDTDMDIEVAEFIKGDFSKIGIDLDIVKLEKNEYLKLKSNGQYQLSTHDWRADYKDPITFLNLFESNNNNNFSKFNNREFDNLIRLSDDETNSVIRLELLKKAEDILMDELPIIPIYFYNDIKGKNKKLKGVIFSSSGKIYFENAYFIK